MARKDIPIEPVDPVTAAPPAPVQASAPPVAAAPAPTQEPVAMKRKFLVAIPHNPSSFAVEVDGTSKTESVEWENKAIEACMKLCGITSSVHKFQVTDNG